MHTSNMYVCIHVYIYIYIYMSLSLDNIFQEGAPKSGHASPDSQL